MAKSEVNIDLKLQDKFSKAFHDVGTRVQRQTKAMETSGNRLKLSFDRQGRSALTFSKSLSSTNRALKSTTATTAVATKSVNRFTSASNAAFASMQGMGGGMAAMNAGFGSLVRSFGKGGIAVAAFSAALTVTGLKTAKAQDELGKLSQRLGVNVETLSSLTVAAERGGTTIEMVGKGIRNLSRLMLDFDLGLKTAKDAFDGLGISLRDGNGVAKSSMMVFKEISDALVTMDDETRRTALAMKAFGASAGPELMPLLLEGSRGIDAYIEKAREMGVVVTAEQATASAKLNDTLADTKDHLLGMSRAIGNQAIPAFTTFFEHINAGFQSLQTFNDYLRDIPLGVRSAVRALAPLGSLFVGGKGLIELWKDRGLLDDPGTSFGEDGVLKMETEKAFPDFPKYKKPPGPPAGGGGGVPSTFDFGGGGMMTTAKGRAWYQRHVATLSRQAQAGGSNQAFLDSLSEEQQEVVKQSQSAMQAAIGSITSFEDIAIRAMANAATQMNQSLDDAFFSVLPRKFREANSHVGRFAQGMVRTMTGAMAEMATASLFRGMFPGMRGGGGMMGVPYGGGINLFQRGTGGGTTGTNFFSGSGMSPAAGGVGAPVGAPGGGAIPSAAMQNFAATLGLAGGALGIYSATQQTNLLGSGITGGVSGALAGAQFGGAPGAVVGGMIGTTAGLLGSIFGPRKSDAKPRAKKALKIFQDMLEGIDSLVTVDQIKTEYGADLSRILYGGDRVGLKQMKVTSGRIFWAGEEREVTKRLRPVLHGRGEIPPRWENGQGAIPWTFRESFTEALIDALSRGGIRSALKTVADKIEQMQTQERELVRTVPVKFRETLTMPGGQRVFRITRLTGGIGAQGSEARNILAQRQVANLRVEVSDSIKRIFDEDAFMERFIRRMDKLRTEKDLPVMAIVPVPQPHFANI